MAIKRKRMREEREERDRPKRRNVVTEEKKNINQCSRYHNIYIYIYIFQIKEKKKKKYLRHLV
jgi:hypothetical protein